MVASLKQQSCVGGDADVSWRHTVKSEAGYSRELARTRRSLRSHNVESITNSQARTAQYQAALLKSGKGG